MREFNYSLIREHKWDSEMLELIAAIYKERTILFHLLNICLGRFFQPIGILKIALNS